EVADGQMRARGLEILPESQDIATRGTQVAHRLANFVFGFAQAEHHSRFGVDGFTTAFFDQLQHGQGPVVGGAGTNVGSQSAHRPQVVVDDLGVGLQHRFNRGFAGIEVGNEDLDNNARYGGANGFNRAPEVVGASVGQIVAGHGRDHDVLEAHAAGRFG